MMVQLTIFDFMMVREWYNAIETVLHVLDLDVSLC